VFLIGKLYLSSLTNTSSVQKYVNHGQKKFYNIGPRRHCRPQHGSSLREWRPSVSGKSATKKFSNFWMQCPKTLGDSLSSKGLSLLMIILFHSLLLIYGKVEKAAIALSITTLSITHTIIMIKTTLSVVAVLCCAECRVFVIVMLRVMMLSVIMLSVVFLIL
jgi:hypothetical protein